MSPNPLSKPAQANCKRAITLAENAMQQAKRLARTGVDTTEDQMRAQHLIDTHRALLLEYDDANYGKT